MSNAISEKWKLLRGRVRPTKRKPKSRLRHVADALIMTVLLGYLLLLCFPQLLFAHSVSYRNFQVYSASPISSNIYPILRKADQKLSRSEIYDPSVSYHVFLCPSHAAFACVAPSKRTAFALNLAVVHNIFVNTADVPADQVIKGPESYDRRTLSSLLAHECTHTLLAKRFALAKTWEPDWKQEGYCEYVAQTTSFDGVMGLKMLEQGKSSPAPAFFYFKAFTAVSYLKDKKHWSITRIMDTPLDLDTVVRESLTQIK